VCCSVLQCVAACCRAFAVCCSVLQRVAACCRVLQCVAVQICSSCVVSGSSRSPLPHVCCRMNTGCCSVLQCVAVCCSVLQCVAVCCSVLQYRFAHHLQQVAPHTSHHAFVLQVWQCVARFLQGCSAHHLRQMALTI